MMKSFQRIVLIVLDSLGVGEMADAADFGDQGSDTLGHIAQHRQLCIPNLQKLGIGNIRPLAGIPPAVPALGSFGKMALASPGKDTTAGHWEMMGLVLEKPFPTYPQGFPDEIIQEFESAVGRHTLGNYPASGTEIIAELGKEHLRTGYPIVYTSADSVFQIAAHEGIVPIRELYDMCAKARHVLTGDHQVGRVIARPFVGMPGRFQRTTNRRDYAIPPYHPTVLDQLQQHRITVTGVGKIASIYCHRGIERELKTRSNEDTAEKTIQAMQDQPTGLIFSNFVDFDMLYGHRNDVEGYATALEEFDEYLANIISCLTDRDLLLLVSDHGCDPTTRSTDHSREYTLLLTYNSGCTGNINLGTRQSLADTGATVADNFGVRAPAGQSFLSSLE